MVTNDADKVTQLVFCRIFIFSPNRLLIFSLKAMTFAANSADFGADKEHLLKEYSFLYTDGISMSCGFLLNRRIYFPLYTLFKKRH
jgi:hypothetical protein